MIKTCRGFSNPAQGILLSQGKKVRACLQKLAKKLKQINQVKDGKRVPKNYRK